MSITSSVRLTISIFILGVTVAAGLATAMPSVAAPVRGPVDIATRIVELEALQTERSSQAVAATTSRDAVRNRLTSDQRLLDTARARTDALGVRATEASGRYDMARDRVGALAAAAYRGGVNNSDLMLFLASSELGDYAYDHEIVARVVEQRRLAVVAAKRERATAVALAKEARVLRNRLIGSVSTLTRELQVSETRAIDAEVANARVAVWLGRWRAIAGGVGTTIRGDSGLTADELATWFSKARRGARITVPMQELTRFYLHEGSAAGVRGDIAFAQSILETGSFWFPDNGQVLPTDNNFAGMDACDSCASGRRYPDAQTGVRAQLQLLRVYADPNLRNEMLDPPAVNPRLDTHFLKGRVTTWGGLTHTWATANAYGDRIIAIYAEILAWLQARADL
ncbi:MAG: hypothetical protein EXQ69_08355 [Acidimicrobiia bacterium]|nr:hypothetical protein [Acidimicrobiia bacterium]